MATTRPWLASNWSDHRVEEELTLFDQAPEPAAAPGPPPAAAFTAASRLRLTVAYEGSGFHGFAVNPGVATVGGTLAEALGTVLGHDIKLTCAGRTDTGVHAWGQVVHLDTSVAEPDVVRLQRSLNTMLAPAIVVRSVELASADFDARHAATGRRYRYTVVNRPVPDPFLAATAWYVVDPLDLGSMRLACDPLIGEHDWSSFCRRPPDPEGSLVRVVRSARWSDLGEGVLRFEIEAGAFCHQMVRSVVGTLVAVGAGKLRAGEMSTIIRARDRRFAGQPAPPHGLCLWEVTYG